MKNAEIMKMKPFGLLKFKRFDKEKRTNELSSPRQEVAEPSEAPTLSPPLEEGENAFLSFCQAHDERARRLRKR